MTIREPLFTNRLRDEPDSKRAAESTYKFIDRVDDAAFAQVRATLNAWFDRFSARQDSHAVADLRGRLRAKRPLQFEGAFWELYLHELHTRLGFEVEVHPPGPRTTRPDFLVSQGDSRFYLEAVVPAPTAGMSTEPGGSQTVIEHVEAAYDDDFFLTVRFATGGELPRRKAVIAAVEQWLDTLQWSRWHDDNGLRYPLPETELTVGDWVIGLQAIPRSPDTRGKRDLPTVVVYPGFSAFVESAMAAAVPVLDEKASKYGQLDAPHVIAAWIMSPLASEASLPSALFGARVPLELGRHPLDLPGPASRRGIWTPDRQDRTRPAAFLMAGSWDFNFNAVARTLPRLWHNPWAADPFIVELPFASSRVVPDESSIANTGSKVDPAELFELASDWPGIPFVAPESSA